jgi:hypothetical protein
MYYVKFNNEGFQEQTVFSLTGAPEGFMACPSEFEVGNDFCKLVNGQIVLIETAADKQQYMIDMTWSTRMDNLRNLRNRLLSNCDWTQSADSPLNASQKAAWATYRQQLRDLTDSIARGQDPEAAQFPVAPN